MCEELKGLIVDQPWIDLILHGDKTWEMRTRRTSHRGLIALVRKGSGQVVGAADLIETRTCDDPEHYRKYELYHRVPAPDHVSAARRWPIAWVLKSARQFTKPVPYRHKRGAQSQILLSAMESETVRASYRAFVDDHTFDLEPRSR
jgi:hypothetical protein